MAYSIPDILQWAKISQPLARQGETNKQRRGDNTADLDLDIKIYDTRLDVAYAYAQDPNDTILIPMGNYLYALCFPYVLTAQDVTGSGGSISPINPADAPDPYDFDVSASSFIATGATSKVFPASWRGFNIILVRGHITQSKVNNGVDIYYSWDRDTATLNFLGTGSAAALGENIQVFPLS